MLPAKKNFEEEAETAVEAAKVAAALEIFERFEDQPKVVVAVVAVADAVRVPDVAEIYEHFEDE
jgi:hypothetical protein